MRPLRLASVVLWGGLVGLTASGQAPAPQPAGTPPGTQTVPGAVAKAADPAMPKDDMAKDKDKKPDWPKEIGGRDPAAYIKDLADHDPHIRNVALQTLPKFGPEVRDLVSKPLVKALEREMIGANGDTAVIVSAVNAIETLGVAPSEVKEACRYLGVLITKTSLQQTLYRFHAIPALASFGHKAENAVTVLSESNVMGDRSYEVRKMAVSAMAHVGLDESKGPSIRALDVLCGLTSVTGIKDPSVAVRVEAFHVLVEMGPPIEPRTPGSKAAPVISKAFGAKYQKAIKDRFEVERAKGDKQVEVWARVAVMRFDPEKEINQKNMTELATLIKTGDTATKLHALNGIGLLGERAERQLTTIMEALDSSDPLVLDAAVKTLVKMGDKAKPALPAMKDVLEKRPEEYFKELLKVATKMIEDAKPSGVVEAPDPSKPDPKAPAVPPKK